MIKYIARQGFRSFRYFLKSYGLFYCCFILAIYFAVAFLTSLNLGFYLSVFHFTVMIALASSYYVFIVKSCSFRMHPATFHFTFNTKSFFAARIMSIAKALFAIVFVYLLMKTIISIVMYEIGILLHMSLFVFMVSCLLLKWIKYKSKNLVDMFFLLAGFVFSSLTFILFSSSEHLLFLFFQFACLLLTFFHNLIKKLDWGSYLKDMTYYALLNYAGNHKDIALMQQIAAEHASEKKRMIVLSSFRLNKRNAIFYKSVVEFIRINKLALLVASAAVIIAIFFRERNLIPYIPMADIDLGRALSAFFVTSLTTGTTRMFRGGLSSILNKSLCGLFLPYSIKEIISKYYLAAGIVVSIIIIIAALLHQAHLSLFLVSIVFGNILVFVSLYLECNLRQKNHIIDFLLGTLFYIVSLLIV